MDYQHVLWRVCYPLRWEISSHFPLLIGLDSWLPQPMNFFFLACIGFYFLCICLRIRPLASIIGALGFAFSFLHHCHSHNTRMALGYAPAVIGAVILIFDKKYISGFMLTALLTALQIGQGHQQISYYLFLVLLAMGIAYTIRMLKAVRSRTC